MTLPVRARLRQAGVLVVFAVGVFATAATSPPQHAIPIEPEQARVRLDQAHPAALTRIVVRLNAEATSAYSSTSAGLSIEPLRPAGAGSQAPAGGEPARFILASIAPDDLVPGDPGEPPVQPGPSPFQSEVKPGLSVTLPISCGVGPCERAFWLIAQLTHPGPETLDVAFSVRGTITYPSATWPSGAGGTIVIDPPIPVAGPIPALVVATEPEIVELGPTRPAAARLVEVSIGPEALPATGEPIAVMSVDLTPRAGSGGDYDRRPIVRVYPLEGIEAANPDGPLPPAFGGVSSNPFDQCPPGEACKRRFLVTIEWAGAKGEDEAYDFGVTVRRTDLVRAWSAPAELSATLERRFDVAPDAKSETAHFEGQSTVVRFDDPAQVQIELAAMTSATDPLARLLPAPAVVRYRTRVLGPVPAPSPETLSASARIEMPGAHGGSRPIHENVGRAGGAVTANPFAGCPVGDACPYLTIRTIPYISRPEDPLPTTAFEWSLDVTLYSFTEAPLSLSSIDRSPPAR